MYWSREAKLIAMLCLWIFLSAFNGNCFAQALAEIKNQVKVDYKDTVGNNYYTESNIIITPLTISGIDLWAIKKGPAEVIPGGIATYTITYGNSGTQTAYGVKLCDQFPAQMESVIYQNSGYFLTIDPITKYGTWNIDILPPGTYSFTMSIKIKKDAISSLVNVMKIESPLSEMFIRNNYSTATTNIRIPQIDLWVKKQGPTISISGSIATYTITYGNYGSETAGNVILTDKFPDQMETILSQTSGFAFTYDNLARCGVWNVGNVAFGTYSFKLAIKIKGNIQCPATMTNTLKIAYPGAETNYTNNQATVTTSITDVDMEICKYGPSEAAQGEEFEYRIILRNCGNSKAENVKITDILPPELIYVSSDIIPVATTTNIIIWEMGNLSGYAYRSFNLKVKVVDNVSASSTITNIIKVTTTNLETNYFNNRATWTTHICLPEPKLKIRKWQNRSDVTAGQRMDYFIRYSNDGKGKAMDGIITDYLPSGVSYVSDDSGLSREVIGNKVIWSVGTISPNTSKDFKLTVSVDKYVQASTTLTNVIEITSPTYQNKDNKDRWTCTTHVVAPIADVLIYKWGPDEVLYGTEFNYEITYNNNSANDADGVVIKDILDPQLIYISDTSGITPKRNRNEITWDIGTMTPWSSGNFLLRVLVPQSVPASSTLTNCIEITTLTQENRYNNNRVTVTTHVGKPKVDVGIEKKGDDARPGFIKKYHITYYNNGTEQAEDVVIIDKLPPEVQYISSNGGGIYNSASHTVTWNIGTLPPQTTRYLVIEVRIPATQQCGVNLYNYIEIKTISPEYDYTNNKYTEIETVVTSIDPNDKLVSPQKYIQDNELLNYTIRFENQATATASAILITIEDKLDVNLDWTTFKFGDIKIGQETYTLENFNKGSLAVSYDVGSGTIRWEFDFKTGTNGLLPNVIPPEGEGYVNFSIRAKQGLPAGTEITNLASIRFDYNLPMNTPAVTNIVDLNKPNSKVLPINKEQTSTSFVVNWTGTDTAGNKAGEIESYTVYVSDNGGSFTKWLNETWNTSGTFTGKTGHTYAFYCVAKDRAGNSEEKAPATETYTSLTAIPTHFVIATLTTKEMCVGGTQSLRVDIYNNEGQLVTDYVGTATLRDKLGIVGIAAFTGTSTWIGEVTIPQSPNGGTDTITVEAPGVIPAVSDTFLVLINRYVGGTVSLFTPGVGTTTIIFGTSTFIPNQDFYVLIKSVSPFNVPEGGVAISAREITAYNMNHNKLTGTFTTSAYLEIPYPDANQDGLVDGSNIKESSLQLYILENNQWKEIEPCGVNVDKNIVWCNINHLSTFMPIGILVAPSQLGNVAVYPNPFKPNSGLGHEYITFGSKHGIGRRLTKYATIKIFTVSGDLVRTLEVVPEDNGQKVWDTRNDAGKEVASGIYIYLITNPEGEKCIGKLAIIR